MSAAGDRFAESVRAEVDLILRVYGIDADDGDIEAAHGMEDELLGRFVRAVANGEPGVSAASVELVRLLDANRTRWYA